MRKREREITDPAELHAVLHAGTVVHLAMVDAGRPYVVPMNYGYADGCLYLHCATEGRKLDILRRNPSVCFSVVADNAVVPGPPPAGCNFTARYRSVIGEGRAEFIEGLDAKRAALDILMRQYAPGAFQYRDEVVEKTCVFRVVIASMTGKKANV